MLVACLGLFGLAAFSAEYRTKEIGVRKVLGASVGSVAALLSKEFIQLVIIAIVIALPLSAYMMQKWLDDFAYRIHFSWWMFFISGLVAIDCIGYGEFSCDQSRHVKPGEEFANTMMTDSIDLLLRPD